MFARAASPAKANCVLSPRRQLGNLSRALRIFLHRSALIESSPHALPDGRSPSSSEGFTSSAKGIVRFNALNLPATKFSESALSLSKPQLFGISFNFVIQSRNQPLGKPDTLSWR